MPDVTLTADQAMTLEAFCDAFDLCCTGQWTAIREHMTDNGIDGPDRALDEARAALRGNAP